MIIEGTISNDHFSDDHFSDVRVDGQKLEPGPSQQFFNHSDGFAWGYGGGGVGSAQLALAILLRAGVPQAEAVALHQRFKAAFIAPLPTASFRLEVDVPAWVAANLPLVAVPSKEE